jgi:2-hydroxychromene-2-carboxylate isomerase
MSAELDFWFDVISPYARFAWPQVQVMCAARGVVLRARPVLLGALLGHWGQLGPAEIPPKREFTYKDCFRYAARHGLKFVPPAMHPFNPLTALRTTLPEVAGADQHRVIDALFDGGWRDGLDLGDADVIAGILTRAGLDGKALVAATAGPDVKDALKASVADAIAAGVFGVPTFVVRHGGVSELFWGNDRLDDVERWIEGDDPYERAGRPVITRPGIVRPR